MGLVMMELKIGTGGDGMGWFEFISSLVGSLAWPLAAVAIALMFRSQIAALLAKVRKLSWGDSSVELAEQLDKVEDNSRAVEPSLEAAVPDQRFQQLLAISPSAAILDAWGTVERMLYQVGTDQNLEAKILTQPLRIMDSLARNETISPTIYEMLRDLRNVRNSAAHQQEVTVADAIRFHDLSEKVVRALDKIEP